MKKKLAIIPIFFLTTGLLLTGCTGGGDVTPTPTGAPSSSATPPGEVETGEIEIPDNVQVDYKQYVHPYFTIPAESGWEYYRSIGAKTHEEDPTNRTTSAEEWNRLRSDSDYTKFDKVYGEATSDIEQTAVNVSEYLAENPEATLESIPRDELVINRFKGLMNVLIVQDPTTKYFFVIARSVNDEEPSVNTLGVVVPQEGVTPEGVGEVDMSTPVETVAPE